MLLYSILTCLFLSTSMAGRRYRRLFSLNGRIYSSSFGAPYPNYAIVNDMTFNNPMMRPHGRRQAGPSPPLSYSMPNVRRAPTRNSYASRTVVRAPNGISGISINNPTSTSTLSRCFMLFPNCILIKAVPFERKIRSSPMDCAQYCMDTASLTGGVFVCRSYIFDKVHNRCDLFDVSAKDPPAFLWKYKLFDYYELKRGCTVSPGTSMQNGEYGSRTAKPTTPPTLSTTATTQTSTPDTTVTPLGPGVCPEATGPIFMRVDGQQLEASETLAISNVSEEDCVAFCVADQGPNGAYECLAATYNFLSSSCVLSSNRALPAGTGTLEKDMDSTYIEKACVPEDLAIQCPLAAMLERIGQMILVGLNEQMTTVDTFQLCLELCLDSQRNFGFVCRSIMFYSSRQQDNCVLNKVDHNDEPSLFSEENFEQVDYISFAPCVSGGDGDVRPRVLSRRRTLLQQAKNKEAEKSTRFSLGESVDGMNFRPLREFEEKQKRAKSISVTKSDPFGKFRKKMMTKAEHKSYREKLIKQKQN